MKVKIAILFSLLLSFPLFQFGQGLSSGSQSIDSIRVKEVPKAIHIININFGIERTRNKLLKMNYYLEVKDKFVHLDSLIKIENEFIDTEAEEFKQFNPNNLSKYFLENTFRAWSGYKNKLEGWMELVNEQVVSTQDNLSTLDFDKNVWQLTLENEEVTDKPSDLIERIAEIIKDIEHLELQFLKYRRDMIIREDQISEIIMVTDNILEKVSQLQKHLRDNLFVADKPMLWQTGFSKMELLPIWPKLKKAWHENVKIVSNFSKEINYFYLIVIAVLIVVLFFLIKKGFTKLGLSGDDPNFVVVRRIFFDHPYATVISLVFTLLILFYSTIPLILTGLFGTLLLICALIFLPAMIGKQGKVILIVILILYVFNLTEIVVWYFGNFARLFITAESLLALFLTYKYGLQGFKRVSKSAAPFVKEIWLLSTLLFILFATALVANLFGYMNLAVLTLKIGVKAAAITVIIFGAHAILRAMVLASIEIGRNTKSRVMAKRWDVLQKRTIQVIFVLAVLFMLKYVLQNMEVYRPVMDWLVGFLAHKWQIGSMGISIGGIFSLILILAFSFGFANFFKVIVEDEFLVRAKLPKGVPAAISITIRYFIIVLGVSMALSAAGIDLGKFGLLAGALGVGIGFGLQNIVNNFISGLILVYERPLNVGDTVEVENLMGIVNRVGVRSSNVRTFDGAEVIVPNGNLISNQMINWTLSDNQRRIEIKIGAAYGSDPNVVLELLKKVALDHDDVLKEPQPLALFEEFGDSSLNFRLLFWVPFELGIGVKSDIAIGVYNIFAENNITIPFPQVDLNVKKEDEEMIEDAKPKHKSKPKAKKTIKSGPVEDAELGNDSVNDLEK